MSEPPSLASQPSVDTLNRPPPHRKWVDEVWIHITKHVGVGIICSVAYFDPYVSFTSTLAIFLCRQQGSFYPQGELERRSPGRLRLWVQTSLRHTVGRPLCCGSSGNFRLLPFRAAKQFSSITCQKSLACRLGVVTGLSQLVSVHVIFYPRPLTLLN